MSRMKEAPTYYLIVVIVGFIQLATCVIGAVVAFMGNWPLGIGLMWITGLTLMSIWARVGALRLGESAIRWPEDPSEKFLLLAFLLTFGIVLFLLTGCVIIAEEHKRLQESHQ